jgi:hypothetical protein
MPMPAASASMPMPSYARKYGTFSRGKLQFTFSSKLELARVVRLGILL